MRERIRGFTEAIVEDAKASGDLRVLADEIAAVARLLAANEDLLVVLSDPGIAGHARRAVVADVFESRVSAAAAALLTFAVEADRATEFIDNVTWLATRVGAAFDGLHPVGDGPLGRAGATERLDGYATAVLAPVASQDGLANLEDEMFRFSRIVEGAEAVLAVLTDRDVPAAARRGLVSDLLVAKATPAAVRLAVYATQVGRPRDYPELLVGLVARVAAESDRRVAEVRAAIDMTGEQQRRLGAALGRIIGHEVEVRVIVDRTVLGGFVASIGDSVVDGSARHRLDQIKERLVLPEANVIT